jgi:hypothetical protein
MEASGEMKEYPICDSCLYELHDRIVAATGEKPNVRVRLKISWMVCRFNYCFVPPFGSAPTNKTIRLPRVIAEGSPQIRQVKPLRSIEMRFFEALAWFIGNKPLKRLALRMFLIQRKGSFYLQALTTKMNGIIEEE